MHNFGRTDVRFLIRNVAGSVLALSLLASAAVAQTDRLIEQPTGGGAPRIATTIDCDFPTLTAVRTQNTAVTFTNTAFLNLPGALLTFETFGSRCVKVHFTAKANATGACFVRAVLNGIVMHPQGQDLQTLVSADSTSNAHAYEWASNVGDGTHTFVIQHRVSAGTCTIDDWTVDLEVWDN